MMKRTISLVQKICFISLVSLITGCYSYTTKVESIGVLEYVEYWRHSDFNPHSTRGVYKRRLCSKTLNQCWNGMGSITLYKNQRYLIAKLDSSVRILDTQTGDLVSCKNCQEVIPGLKDFDFPLGLLDSTRDRNNPQELLSFILESNGDRFDVLVNFSESQGELTLLQTDSRSQEMPRLKTEFSPDGSKIAWYSCSPLCTLVVYDFSKAAFNYTDTPCAKTNGKYLYLLIDWVDEKVVSTQHRAALRNKNAGLCTKPDGTPYFPVAM